jgi:hypothetical protein
MIHEFTCPVTGKTCQEGWPPPMHALSLGGHASHIIPRGWQVTCTHMGVLHIYESEDVTLRCIESKQCQLLFKLHVIYNVIV